MIAILPTAPFQRTPSSKPSDFCSSASLWELHRSSCRAPAYPRPILHPTQTSIPIGKPVFDLFSWESWGRTTLRSSRHLAMGSNWVSGHSKAQLISMVIFLLDLTYWLLSSRCGKAWTGEAGAGGSGKGWRTQVQLVPVARGLQFQELPLRPAATWMTCAGWQPARENHPCLHLEAIPGPAFLWLSV